MSKKYILNFHQQATEKPITYLLVKDFDIKINIISAKIEAGEAGTLILEMHGGRLDEAIAFIKSEGIDIHRMSEEIEMDRDRCVDCGACIAVCPVGALTINRYTAHVELDPDSCVACGMCVKACPRRAITLAV